MKMEEKQYYVLFAPVKNMDTLYTGVTSNHCATNLATQRKAWLKDSPKSIMFIIWLL